ncbi:MAG: alpha/beta fold hydrolase, partial [Anaerolineales bacterium]|nr:alpha/beta fold hydrolase [Anaerolineales bacterium]
MPFLNVNGVDLYYEVNGKGQTVVFIHGLGSSCQDWEKQEPVFSKQYQVVTLDLRGHGKSQKPSGPYSIALFARDVAGLIRSLNLAPVHVVGISLGGMIALQLAADHPELVRSFVAANNNSEMIVRTWKDRWEIFMRTNV